MFSMRSFTVLALTVSAAAVASAQEPDRAGQMRDSIQLRQAGLEGQIERIATQLLISSQVQARARRSLETLRINAAAQANRAELESAMNQLREQITEAGQQAQTLRAQLASLCDRNAKPQGYMGITFSATMQANSDAGGAEVFRFGENPTVETVEPGSPAERAGVEKGDEIILLAGRPVVGHDIVFSRLLRPGSRLPIRVRRDGDTKDVVLVVGQRPPSLDNGCPFLDARIMAAFGDPISINQLPLSGAIVRAPTPPSAAPRGNRVRVVSPAEASPAPTASGTVTVTVPTPAIVPGVVLPTTPNAPDGPAQRQVYVFRAPSSPMVIAGATIVRTNADLRETFGVKSGVLVLDVARGSPAYASGLKGGDVIVSVGRSAVTSPLSVQHAMEAADGKELPLRIIRKKREQSLTLRW